MTVKFSIYIEVTLPDYLNIPVETYKLHQNSILEIQIILLSLNATCDVQACGISTKFLSKH